MTNEPLLTPPEGTLVQVVWQDAWFDFDEPDEARDQYLVHTVGFLIRSGPRFISVAQEILPHGDGYRAITHIPIAVVEVVEALLAGEQNGKVHAVPTILM
jgi:hypothetical protein